METTKRCSVTVKSSPRADASWFVLHFDTPAECEELVRGLFGIGDEVPPGTPLDELVAMAAGTFAAKSVLHGYEAPAPSPVVPTQWAGPEKARTAVNAGGTWADQHANDLCRQCGSHMLHKTGRSSKGPWEGMFCQNSSCKHVDWRPKQQ